MVLTRTGNRLPPAVVGYLADPGSSWAARAAELAQLAVDLYDAAGPAETVDRVLEYAVRATGADCTGVVLVHRGKGLQTAGVTDRRVERADRLQVRCGEGPCVPVSRDRHSVLVCDTITDQRWPRWSPRIAELGLRSVLTIPLFTARSTLGALNLYANRPDQFTTVDETAADLLARHASVAIATARDAATSANAVEARTVIGRAQGLLMERFGIDADQAFAVLRRYSQDNNVKLRIVADALVSTRRLPAGQLEDKPMDDR